MAGFSNKVGCYKMRNNFVLAILLLLSIQCYSQRQDRIWVFRDSSGIDFNNLSSPILFNSNVNNNTENHSCISDTSGQLLFYLNGRNPMHPDLLRICDRNGNTMLNGDSLFTDYTQTQGSVIIPFPSLPQHYLVIYEQFWSASQNGFPYGIFYSVVDMTQNGGLGKVVSKNQPIVNHQIFSEKIAAVRHANGRDWWVLAHGLGDNHFYEFLVDPAGIHGPYSQNIGTLVADTTLYYAYDGQMKFSSCVCNRHVNSAS